MVDLDCLKRDDYWEEFSHRNNLQLSDDVTQLLATMTSTEIFYFMNYRIKKRSLKFREDLRKESEEVDDGGDGDVVVESSMVTSASDETSIVPGCSDLTVDDFTESSSVASANEVEEKFETSATPEFMEEESMKSKLDDGEKVETATAKTEAAVSLETSAGADANQKASSASQLFDPLPVPTAFSEPFTPRQTKPLQPLFFIICSKEQQPLFVLVPSKVQQSVTVIDELDRSFFQWPSTANEEPPLLELDYGMLIFAAKANESFVRNETERFDIPGDKGGEFARRLVDGTPLWCSFHRTQKADGCFVLLGQEAARIKLVAEQDTRDEQTILVFDPGGVPFFSSCSVLAHCNSGHNTSLRTSL